MDWNSIYTHAIIQMASRSNRGRHGPGGQRHSDSSLAYFIAQRIRKIAFQFGCEWQANWGDPRKPGQVDPQFDQDNW